MIPPFGFVAAILAYLLVALGLGLVAVNRDYRPAKNGVDVYVRSNGVHADVVLPIVAGNIDWRRRLPAGTLFMSSGRSDLAFGWGDRGFYISTPTWSDIHVATALNALIGQGPTVVHVESAFVPAPSALVRHLRLTNEQYRRLVDSIDESFEVDPHGAKIAIYGAHYWSGDAFFEGRGRYSLFVTCNEWTRRLLAKAGVRVPAWAPFDTALLLQLPAND